MKSRWRLVVSLVCLVPFQGMTAAQSLKESPKKIKLNRLWREDRRYAVSRGPWSGKPCLCSIRGWRRIPTRKEERSSLHLTARR